MTVRFFWRNGTTPLTGHAQWVQNIDPKNRQLGTSAPTLAASCSGPLDLFGALASQPELAGITVDHVNVEAKVIFDLPWRQRSQPRPGGARRDADR